MEVDDQCNIQTTTSNMNVTHIPEEAPKEPKPGTFPLKTKAREPSEDDWPVPKATLEAEDNALEDTGKPEVGNIHNDEGSETESLRDLKKAGQQQKNSPGTSFGEDTDAKSQRLEKETTEKKFNPEEQRGKFCQKPDHEESKFNAAGPRERKMPPSRPVEHEEATPREHEEENCQQDPERDDDSIRKASTEDTSLGCSIEQGKTSSPGNFSSMGSDNIKLASVQAGRIPCENTDTTPVAVADDVDAQKNQDNGAQDGSPTTSSPDSEIPHEEKQLETFSKITEVPEPLDKHEARESRLSTMEPGKEVTAPTTDSTISGSIVPSSYSFPRESSATSSGDETKPQTSQRRRRRKKQTKQTTDKHRDETPAKKSRNKRSRKQVQKKTPSRSLEVTDEDVESTSTSSMSSSEDEASFSKAVVDHPKETRPLCSSVPECEDVGVSDRYQLLEQRLKEEDEGVSRLTDNIQHGAKTKDTSRADQKKGNSPSVTSENREEVGRSVQHHDSECIAQHTQVFTGLAPLPSDEAANSFKIQSSAVLQEVLADVLPDHTDHLPPPSLDSDRKHGARSNAGDRIQAGSDDEDGSGSGAGDTGRNGPGGGRGRNPGGHGNGEDGDENPPRENGIDDDSTEDETDTTDREDTIDSHPPSEGSAVGTSFRLGEPPPSSPSILTRVRLRQFPVVVATEPGAHPSNDRSAVDLMAGVTVQCSGDAPRRGPGREIISIHDLRILLHPEQGEAQYVRYSSTETNLRNILVTLLRHSIGGRQADVCCICRFYPADTILFNCHHVICYTCAVEADMCPLQNCGALKRAYMRIA